MKWLEPLRESLGITDEVLAESYRQVVVGEDDPLPGRQAVKDMERKLTRRQRLLRVWELTLEDGRRPLIFELADGSLWQLSDVGLGWTSFHVVGPEWTEHPATKAYLPADIVPRPSAAAPWDYEFTLAGGAVLWVKPGLQRQTFRWGVRTSAASAKGDGAQGQRTDS